MKTPTPEQQARIDILQDIYDNIKKGTIKREFVYPVNEVFKKENEKLNEDVMNWNYPDGALNDPRAPWNDLENQFDANDRTYMKWQEITVANPDERKNINVLFKIRVHETNESLEVNILDFKYPVFYTNWPEDIEIFYEIETAKKVKCYIDFDLNEKK